MTDYRLMIAGPVDSEDDVLSALAEPTLPHYGPLFMPVFNETTDFLKQLFRTTGDVLMMPGPGTGALEAALSSLVPAGQGVCVVSNGHFGWRIGRIVESSGQRPLLIEFPPGAAADPEEIRHHLEHWAPQAAQGGAPIRALAVVHHETSTGVLNPLKEIAEVAREFDLAMIVDAVSSLGGVDVRVDEWEIDACVSVPNKCVGAVPGVGLMSVSARAWQMAEENPTLHGWYTDLRTWARFREDWKAWHPYPTTLPTNVIVALHRALTNLFDAGLEEIIASHAAAARQIREGMAAMGFALFPDLACAAPTLSAFRTREDVDADDMQRALMAERGIAIAGGLEELHGKIFRVGHMGRARSPEYSAAFLDGVRAYLEAHSLPVSVTV